MGAIHFNLNNGGDNFITMAYTPPVVVGAGVIAAAAVPGALPAAMTAIPPNNPRSLTYMIVNTNTNNRYVGISVDIINRFNSRLRTVGEFDLQGPQLQDICAIWGTVEVADTPAAGGALVWRNVPPTKLAGGQTDLSDLIDGMLFDLEAVFIRYVMEELGAGGSVSNTDPGQLMNNSGHNIDITFTWPACNTIANPIPANNSNFQWVAGANL